MERCLEAARTMVWRCRPVTAKICMAAAEIRFKPGQFGGIGSCTRAPSSFFFNAGSTDVGNVDVTGPLVKHIFAIISWSHHTLRGVVGSVPVLWSCDRSRTRLDVQSHGLCTVL